MLQFAPNGNVNCAISCANLRQMVVWFAVFYAMICPKSFHH